MAGGASRRAARRGRRRSRWLQVALEDARHAARTLRSSAVAAVLAVVTLGAAYLPARRASRLDPMSVLRYE